MKHRINQPHYTQWGYFYNAGFSWENSLKKILHSRSHIVFVILIIAALNGIWGNQHINTCVVDGDVPSSYAGFLQKLSLFWMAFAGALFILAFYLPRLSSTTYVVGLTTLSIPGIISAWGITSIDSQCIQPALWMYVIWAFAAIIVVALLHPQVGARLALSAFSLLMLVGFLEAGTRLYFRLDPIYDVQRFKPHPTLGWTHVPNASINWEGRTPGCTTFSTHHQTNAYGFVDDEWQLEKPEDTVRIAVLGDSFIEAFHVEPEQRATNILETRLNNDFADPYYENTTFEVLNFGVGNYSTAQILLLYQEIAAEFEPDYVIVLMSDYVTTRVLNPMVPISYLERERGSLTIRPVLDLNNFGQLIMTIPPSDYDVAMEIYETQVDEQENPVRVPINLIISEPTNFNDLIHRPYFTFVQHSQFLHFLSFRLDSVWESASELILGDIREFDTTPFEAGEDYRQLQTALVRELNAAVTAHGARFIVVDDSEYLSLPVSLQQLSQNEGFTYIRLRTFLEQSSEPLTFLCDLHFNATAHEIFGSVMYESLIQDLAQPTILCATPQMKLFDQKTGDWHVYRIDEESGIFVASFRPSELGGEGLFIEAEDGWSVRITPEEEQYRLRLFTPGSRLVDDSCVFDADQDFNPI